MNGGISLKLGVEERVKIQQMITELKDIISLELEEILSKKLIEKGLEVNKELELVKYNNLDFKYSKSKVKVDIDNEELLWQVEVKLSQNNQKYMSNCIWLTLTGRGTNEDFEVKIYSNCAYTPNWYKFNTLEEAMEKMLELMEAVKSEGESQYIYA